MLVRMNTCRKCDRFATVAGVGLCGTHYQQEWRARNAEKLPAHIELRETYPYRDWLPAVTAKENLVHCVTKVKPFDSDDVFTVPLCDTDAQLVITFKLGFKLAPRCCKRCVSILNRAGLAEDWMLDSVKTA